MVANIKQTLLGYDKTEFLPIYRNNKIDNMDEFVKYKVKKAIMPTLMKINDVFENH